VCHPSRSVASLRTVKETPMHLEAYWQDHQQLRWSGLTTLHFVDGVRVLCIAGQVGAGKPFMATALGHVAVLDFAASGMRGGFARDVRPKRYQPSPGVCGSFVAVTKP
jgi:hypothetical protein